jgi:hypothetical protein
MPIGTHARCIRLILKDLAGSPHAGGCNLLKNKLQIMQSRQILLFSFADDRFSDFRKLRLTM